LNQLLAVKDQVCDAHLSILDEIFILLQYSIMTPPVNTKEMVADQKTTSSVKSAEIIDPTSADEAQDVVFDTVNAEYTEADYKRVLRKADRFLLPFMWLCCGIQSVDKASISTQATFGMLKDTHLVGQQFSCKQGPSQRYMMHEVYVYKS
jgi:hypothetical protein